MATERIDIVVTERGSRVVKRNLEDIGSGAERGSKGVDLLKRALGGLATATTLLALGRMLDTFQNLQNRLRQVTTSTAQLNAVTDRLFQISNSTRSSFESTTEVFARTALALKDLGVSQQETLDFTESLNQAVILSGASAQEANAALIQLSQGLASGTLRGDELRSVLEQLPAVADVIARGLGVTRGELRELGAQGKITAKDILKAFKDAREELAGNFAKALPTPGQALTVLQNKFLQFAGEMDKANGLSATFAKTVLLLADNMDTLMKVVGAAAITIGTVLAGRAIPAAIGAVKSLTLAIAANPFGALAIAVTAAASALFTFGDQLFLNANSMITVRDLFLSAFDVIGSAILELGSMLITIGGTINDALGRPFDTIELSVEGVLRATAKAADAYMGVWVGAYRAVVTAFESFPNAIKDIFTSALNGGIALVEGGVNEIVSALNMLPGVDIGNVSLDRLQNDAAGGAAQAGKNIADAFLSGFETSLARDTLDKVIAGAQKRATERAAARAAAEAERQAALEGLKKTSQDLTAGAEERNKLLKAEDAILKSLRGPTEEYKMELDAVNSLLAKHKISSEEAMQVMRDLRITMLETATDLQSGFQRGLLKISKEFTDMATLAENAVTNAFRGMEDALVNFVTKGKLDFASLANSIISDLARIAIRSQITGPLSKIFSGFFNGGGGSSFNPIASYGPDAFQPATFTFASGGLVSGPGGPTQDLVNARLSNGEFVVNAASTKQWLPLLQAINDNAPAPARQAASANMPAMGTEVNIYDQRASQDSQAVETQEGTTADGRKQINVIIRDTVNRQLASGEFDRAMRTRYDVGPSLQRRG